MTTETPIPGKPEFVADFDEADVPIGRPEGDFGPRVVKGLVHPDFPALALTPDMMKGFTMMPSGTYSITHRASGWRVIMAPTIDDALRAFRRLAPMLDWSQDRDALMTVPKDHPIRAAIHELHEEFDW